jgi:hypothetical protein
MDTCGCVAGGDHGTRPRHDAGGPPGWGGFDQVDWPLEDQWSYHAVGAVILGHSLLRARSVVGDFISVHGSTGGTCRHCQDGLLNSARRAD